MLLTKNQPQMSEVLQANLANAATEFFNHFEALYAVDEHAAIKLAAKVTVHVRISAERTAINDDIRENFNMGFLSVDEMNNALIK